MRRLIYYFIFSPFLCACQNDDYSPKPKAYHRLTLPEKIYTSEIINGCPFTFNIPTYGLLIDDNNKNAKPCWKNVDFPQFNARLHLSYFQINNNTTLNMLTEDARSFVFKHTTKATSIDQKQINSPENNVYGLEYDIKGNTASNYQFYVSDNKRHYIRGALYFNEKPNIDSIQPVLDFLKTDISQLINSIRWK